VVVELYPLHHVQYNKPGQIDHHRLPPLFHGHYDELHHRAIVIVRMGRHGVRERHAATA